jgi:hypothetical protein
MKNAESWYRYVNGPRGREAANGSIYLVTGCDKGKSWGTAAFSNVSRSFSLNFNATAVATGNANYIYSWEPHSLAVTRAGPPIEDFDDAQDRPLNQCIFIRGFRVTLSQGLWATIQEPVGLSMIVDTKPKDLLSQSSFVPFLGGGLWWPGFASNSTGPSSRNDGESHERSSLGESGTLSSDGNVMVVSDFPSTSEVRDLSWPCVRFRLTDSFG